MLSVLRALDLKARIALFGVALFVGAVWLLALDLEREARGKLQNVLAAQQFQTVEHVASSLDATVRLRIDALVDAASLVKPDWMTQPGALHRFLAERAALSRFFNTGMFVISRAGIGLADHPRVPGRDGASYTERDFFRTAMATGKPAVSKPFLSRFLNKPVVVIAVPIKNAHNEIIGVLAGGNVLVGTDLLSSTLPQKSHASGFIHVISPRDGLIVTSSDPRRIMQPAPAAGVNPIYDRFTAGYEGSGVAVNSLGIESLISGKRVPVTDWLVVASLPTAVAFEPINSLRREIYQDAAIASLVIALLLWLFLHNQLSPLGHSARIIDAMADGDEPLRPLPLEGSREIQRLLGSFNKLQRHIAEQARSLQDRAEQMRLAASVFEGTSEAILVTSADNRIVSVNRAFSHMTGYEQSELVGKDPGLMQSGRHDEAFYREMWSSLAKTGQWRGEIWSRRKNGEIFPQRVGISSLCDEAGKVLHYIAMAADITMQKQAEAVIWQQANCDLLTQLPNRHRLQELTRQALEKSQRDKQSLAVLHVDLDHFKEVNDTLGHDVGDQMIVEAGRRISFSIAPEIDTVAHLGGDEFVVLLGSLAETSPRAEEVAEKILRAMAQPFNLGGETVYISASVGMVRDPGEGDDVITLLKNADQAKHAAKAEGRNRLCHFTPSMALATQTRMQLAKDMRGALAARQFEVYYQPIVDLATLDFVKAEALLRWHHPERGIVSPALFIPIAEETGLIGEIGDWVFRQAAQTAKRWYRRCESSSAEIPPGRYQITVNKSPRQFFTGNTDKTWIQYLHENDIQPSCMTIEITEGLLLDQHPEVMEKFMAFRDAGIQVALDDFGTGYSALSYLKKFDIDYIKIDRSFVRDLVTDTCDRAIAEAVIIMAHKLGLKVVAEGVETVEQRDLLVAAGCDYGQGYLFAKPMPVDEFERLVLSPR